MDKVTPQIQSVIDKTVEEAWKKHFPSYEKYLTLKKAEGKTVSGLNPKTGKIIIGPNRGKEKFIKQLNADISGSQAAVYKGSNVYTKRSIPEDAKEEEHKIKNLKRGQEIKKQEKIGEKPDLSNPQKIDDYLKSPEGKSDYEFFSEEIDKEPDLDTPEKRDKAIKSTESDEEAFTGKLNLEAKKERENIEDLKRELDEVRQEYAEMDYKKRKMWGRVKSYFGNILGKGWKERRRDDIETDERGAIKDDDVLYLEAIYKNKLFDYKNTLLGDIFTDDLSEDEKKRKLGEAVNYFGKEEFLKLNEVRDNAKAEYLKNDPTVGHLIVSCLSSIERGYYKLPKAARYAISIGTMASGVGALVIGKRALSGFLLGYASYRGASGLDQTLTNWITKREQEKIISGFESEDHKYKFINEKLNKKLFSVDEKVHGQDWRKLGYATAGAILGTLVGTGKAAEFAHWLSEKVDVGEIPEKFHSLVGKVREMMGKTIADIYPAAEDLPVSGVEDQLGEAGKELTGSLQKLVVEEGSSLQGSISDYLNKNPELIDKYNQLAGGRHFNAGQIAHRMYSDYIEGSDNPLNKSLDLVYQGTEIEIDPENFEISEVSDVKGTIARVIKQVAGDHDSWSQIKQVNLDDLSQAARYRISGLSEQYGKFWGEDAKIGPAEKIKDWIVRVSKIATKMR